MNIEITEKQHRNLLRLRNYFKRVTWDCINQGMPVMTMGKPDPKYPCCFGAHFVGCFRKEIFALVNERFPITEATVGPLHKASRTRTIMDKPSYDWSDFFDEMTGISPVMLVEHGAQFGPFGPNAWAVHPRTVLERILKNVTIK